MFGASKVKSKSKKLRTVPYFFGYPGVVPNALLFFLAFASLVGRQAVDETFVADLVVAGDAYFAHYRVDLFLRQFVAT